MMGPKEVQGYYEGVARKGRASFKLIFRAAPYDRRYSELEPIANVTIVVEDPNTTPHKEMYRETIEMSTKHGEHEVEIEVLNVLSVVKSAWYRLKGKAKPEPYEVTVTVEPQIEWEKDYSTKRFPMKIKLGFNPPLHVWMPRRGPDGLGGTEKGSKDWADKP